MVCLEMLQLSSISVIHVKKKIQSDQEAPEFQILILLLKAVFTSILLPGGGGSLQRCFQKTK